MVLTAGQYNISDFQAAMLTGLKAHFPAASFTSVDYDTISAKLSIKYTGGGAFSVGSTAIGKLGQLMGCDPTGAVTTAANGTLTFPAVAGLFPYSSILMCIDNLPANVLSTSSLHCFARIQVNAPPSGMIMVCNGTNVQNRRVWLRRPRAVPRRRQTRPGRQLVGRRAAPVAKRR